MAQTYSSAERLAEHIVLHVGRQLVVGLPIGIGKATHVVDALFDMACADASISLTIFTGLTLEPPSTNGDLEKRLVEPLAERLYGQWPTPAYAAAGRHDALPDNIQVREFYLRPGAYLNNQGMQQNYSSVNYSQVTRALLDLGVNVILNLVAAREQSPGRYSLSCNPEITLDLMPEFDARRTAGERVAVVGQVNRQLPYLLGEADVDASAFDFILDDPAIDFPLFSLPNRRVTKADYATAMHVASLVKDGGTLQVGIGSNSDAVAHCLLLRHRAPDVFARILSMLPGGAPEDRDTSLPLEIAPFEKGLFASTELMSDALFALFDGGIVKRPADSLDNSVIHAGFYIGSKFLYDGLNALNEHRRKQINMTRISAVNTLYGDEERKRRQRRHARFINETMMVTALGSAVSDALDDGRVVSGVGGQFDFVAMAHDLADAQSILMFRASRGIGADRTSNMRWSYGHTTVPRHHRDVYVSEYGIAATRGKSDREVVEAMLSIADAEFIPDLRQSAAHAGKLPLDAVLPRNVERNTAAAVGAVFAMDDVRPHFPAYPLGTELTEIEQELAEGLGWLRDNTAQRMDKWRTVAAALFSAKPELHVEALERMRLSTPASIGERIAQRLVAYALQKVNNDN